MNTADPLLPPPHPQAMSATGNRNSVGMVSLLSTAAAAADSAGGPHTPRSGYDSDRAGGSASGSSTPSVARFRRKNRGIGHNGGVGGPLSSAASEARYYSF
jgi:hypothetical protein